MLYSDIAINIAALFWLVHFFALRIPGFVGVFHGEE